MMTELPPEADVKPRPKIAGIWIFGGVLVLVLVFVIWKWSFPPFWEVFWH